MLFNSLAFLIFFPVVCLIYFLIPYRYRWVFLLLASYFFYMYWKVEYAILIAISSLTDYFAAIRIAGTDDPKIRKRWLGLSLIMNIGLLVGFKYLNFIIGAFNDLFSLAGADLSLPNMDIVLPVGISFYTFQTLAYTVDVYHNKLQPEHHLGRLSLYVSFFPQLVAGPIERASHLLPQFREEKKPDYDRIVWGLKKIAYGFFKKVVVADRCALYVNEVYGNIDEYSTLPLVVATFLFSIQIYCDFSGYSDIAIGTARILGFDLMENFDRPYLARSISEFWRRWHISLSTWFRDYVYIPLGGNRGSVPRIYFNLFITFVISGLWHGANWTFLIWGAIHGLYLIGERLLKNPLARLHKGGPVGLGRLRRVLQTLWIFLLVNIGWVFFRADTLADAQAILGKIFWPALQWGDIIIRDGEKGLGLLNFGLLGVSLGLLALSYLLPKDLNFRHSFLYLVVVTLIILLLGRNAEAEFIYFQF